MPRIHAESVAAHVEQQERKVFDAAIRLFCERGYANVNLSDVAAEVGLARNSLYRYFPDKAHILVRWFRRELPEQAARSAELLGGDGTPAARIRRWVLAQLDYARRPEHRLIAALGDVAPNLDEQTRAELADSHQRLLAPLASTVAAAGVTDDRSRDAITNLIGGLVLAAAEHEARAGEDGAARDAVLRAIDALLRV